MTLGERLALTHPWWMWSHPSIIAAVAEVHLNHWLPEYHDRLQENERNGRSPTRKELAGDLYLCRNPRNIERMEAAAKQLTGPTLLGLSYSLKMPIAAFFPSWPDWIAGVTLCLIEKEKSEQAALRRHDVVAYALYRERHRMVSHADELSLEETIVQAIWHEQEDAFANARETERAIRKIVRLLGPVLEACVQK
jgi:hypothetical protein